ncbi:hypothetical protein NHX12_022551 [Muraenolepis orangiensis]|uniref:Reverse transcriptase domain-containing protein n=1 Tax=Muraenolepis orangiensis TaxID=630683 RepID=A0A9Q0ENF1_9TELE|nr:hypothetical protein NHX12_022551 [Muraenolepis orangiensis]
MQRNSLFTDKQYGFISGRSTSLQLITVLDEWTSIIDDWGCIDAIYCDFQKAFDKVPHKRLTHKLEGYGVKGNIKEWISSFLNGRTQRVVVNGECSGDSEWRMYPPGKRFRSLLFVIFINDLPDVVDENSRVYLFADDTNLYRRIDSKDD